MFIAPPATALVGDLSFVSCVDDNDSGTEACAKTTDGLSGVVSVVVSPDGENVYTASINDDAVVTFDRGVQLTPIECIDDNDTGPEECSPPAGGGRGGGPPVLAKSTNGLSGLSEIAASPDGKSLYAVSIEDHAIVRFNRQADGKLQPAGCIEDNDSGPDDCTQSTDGLEGANSLAISPDGKSVYVVSFVDNALVHFIRDPATGALTPGGCLDDKNNGPDTCLYGGPQVQDVAGLNGATGVAVSPDGRTVYVVSDIDNAIARFTRNVANGAITASGCIEDNDVGPDTCPKATNGLEGASSVSVSPNGKHVYVGSNQDDAIVLFNRNTSGGVANGKLTPDRCVDDIPTPGDPSSPDNCVRSATGLSGVTSVTVSPDGRNVYATSEHDRAVVIFQVRPSGHIAVPSCIVDDTGPETCAQTSIALHLPASVAVSPDGFDVYVAGAFVDDAVSQFARTNPNP